MFYKEHLSAGVSAMIMPGSSFEDNPLNLELAQRYPESLYAVVGIHPHNAKHWEESSYQQLKIMAQHDKAVAIGETGLDYYRNFSDPSDQKKAFDQQIDLAIESDLPLFMHQRYAHDDFIEILTPKRNELKNAVVHCFTGDEKMLNDYLELDLFIGITGWICDERRGYHLHNLIEKIPSNRLLIETDSPYLLPRNLRPKPSKNRNEPCFLPHIAEQIAFCLNMSVAELDQLSTTNTRQFFGLEKR